jgi:serine/threonine protein kinase
MSPELLASGTKQPGQPFNAAAADVWALGICLFLMVSGVYPFEACSD